MTGGALRDELKRVALCGNLRSQATMWTRQGAGLTRTCPTTRLLGSYASIDNDEFKVESLLVLSPHLGMAGGGRSSTARGGQSAPPPCTAADALLAQATLSVLLPRRPRRAERRRASLGAGRRPSSSRSRRCRSTSSPTSVPTSTARPSSLFLALRTCYVNSSTLLGMWECGRGRG